MTPQYDSTTYAEAEWARFLAVNAPDEEPWTPPADPRAAVACPSCPVSLRGPGLLEHNADGTHTWSPAGADPARAMRDWSRLAAALALVGLVVLVALAAWRE